MARRRRGRPCASSASTSWCSANARRSFSALAEADAASRARAGDRLPRGRRVHVTGAAARRPASSICRRCAGRTDWVARHHHHHHRFDCDPTARAPRSRPRAAAPTSAPSAPRSISATPIAGANCTAAGGDRRADRAGRRLPLFHRRDLPAAAPLAGSAGRARAAVRHPDADRSLEAGDARPARPGRLRLDRGRGGEPDATKAARRSTRIAA